MGVVISIKTDVPCPTCRESMSWQSKRLTYDGFFLAAPQTVPLSERVGGEMQASEPPVSSGSMSPWPTARSFRYRAANHSAS